MLGYNEGDFLNTEILGKKMKIYFFSRAFLNPKFTPISFRTCKSMEMEPNSYTRDPISMVLSENVVKAWDYACIFVDNIYRNSTII